MLARDEDILKAAEDWKKAGRGVALATVVETWGSAPRPVGSNLVIDDQDVVGAQDERPPVLGELVDVDARLLRAGRPGLPEGRRPGHPA